MERTSEYSILNEDTKELCIYCKNKADGISGWNNQPICFECLFKEKDFDEGPSVHEKIKQLEQKEKIMQENYRIEKICELCGNKFETSKFTKYITTCKDCKKKNKKIDHPTKNLNKEHLNKEHQEN